MKWRFAVSPEGKTLDRVMTCDEGYRVAKWTDDGVDSYWPSKSGEFLTSAPLETKKEAFDLCERHYQIMG